MWINFCTLECVPFPYGFIAKIKRANMLLSKGLLGVKGIGVKLVPEV
tara:strand:- start:226 stop:366 length:141 start_codon:yes stop_codon:yes gene_type:complete